MNRSFLSGGLRRRKLGFAAILSGAAIAAAALLAPSWVTAEPAVCLSQDPAQWPSPSKPYFMIGFDTSGSMSIPVAAMNSCGYPDTRIGHGKCALKNMFSAFG